MGSSAAEQRVASHAEVLRFPLPPVSDGQAISITAFRYGASGSGRKAYFQAGLHADEFPGMLALHVLRGKLDAASAKGLVRGEILLLPQANPIGITQWRYGFLLGRNEADSGQNFNRDYADLASAVLNDPAVSLGPDSVENVRIIRAAMSRALAAAVPATPLEALRHRLLTLAHDADLMLDLHADNEAQCHVYTGPALWPEVWDIAAEIDARAVLLAEVSGGHPFDEACGAPWWKLASIFPDVPIPPACVSATLELGSNDDADLARAEAQALALYRVLARRGFVDDPIGHEAAPELRCAPSLLTAMQQVKAPIAGIVVYRSEMGAQVDVGDVVATVVDPLGDSADVMAETSGIFFARHSQTYAWPGKIIGKIAGSSVLSDRHGNLLTD